MMLTKQETNAYIEKYIFKPALVAEKYDAELSKMIDDWKKKCKIRKAKNKADELIKALNKEKIPEDVLNMEFTKKYSSSKEVLKKKQPHDSSCDCDGCIPF